MIIYGLTPYTEKLTGLVRHIRPLWALEEAGAPYELKLLDPKTREHKSSEFLAINPFGKVPVLKDGDFILFESAAIATYVADKYKKLIPAAGTRERNIYDQWCFATQATLEPWTFRLFGANETLEKGPAQEFIKKQAEDILPALLQPFEQQLSRHKFLMGAEFTMVDIHLSSALLYLHRSENLGPYPALKAYAEHNFARPAYERAFKRAFP